MIKYLLSAPSFTGTIGIVYLDGLLVLIDFQECEILDGQKSWILRNIALYQSEVPDMVIRMKTVVCVESEMEVLLSDFTREYPYKRNNHLLPPIWEKLSKSVQVMALMGARKYRKWTEREKLRNPNYKPKIAAGWLHEKQYLNEWDKL